MERHEKSKQAHTFQDLNEISDIEASMKGEVSKKGE